MTSARGPRPWRRAPAGRSGGDRRARVVVLLACVLALNAADTGVIGAIVHELRHSLHIGNTKVGVLTAAPAAVGAVATLPVGYLTDRVPRVPLLAGSVVLWSLAMIVGGVATSFEWLLCSRIALGAVTATAGPTVASLIGDYFPTAERAGMYGRVLAGELVGVGFGLLVGGNIAALLSWRVSFWFVALLGLGLAAGLWWGLAEPARGAQGGGGARGPDAEPAQEQVARRRVPPRPENVLRTDPARMTLAQAAAHVLRIRTNVIIIVASAFGYFFFAGLRTFALVFVQERYGIGRGELSGFLPVIGAAAMGGVLVGGRLADRLVRRGRVSARVTVPGAAFTASAALFLPALFTRDALVALPLFTLAAAALAAANPPLDAVRLDVVHFRLWGRAESIRTIVRMTAEAIAPVLFGWMSGLLDTGGGTAVGLNRVFLLALLPLLANGLLLTRARRDYPRDVASALESERRYPANG
ncbi:MFS transporter [Actinomadura chibensis]|uniref:MFS transporter n=1 Tax=Actinomadura chibensis TaxID=392828 RepID=A0A5D0NWQ2_9ACTN|nr:MFS transporter [Actinomadura chibensis]TYB48966.1 MFS transporter [Actinomadura chibensis]